MQRTDTRPRFAVFTDIDNTFYRADRDTASRQLTQLLCERGILLCAVTGASFPAVRKRIVGGELPAFQALASAVGTEIYLLETAGEDPTYVTDPEWEAMLRERGFVRDNVATKLEQHFTALNSQHSSWQAVWQTGTSAQSGERFKLSLWYMAEDSTEAEAIFHELAKPFAAFRCVWCEDINYSGPRKRYCFDVLAADKADAVAYLFKRLSLAAGLVAGDSGNDATMILQSTSINGELTGVVVGGARPELLAAVHAAGYKHTAYCRFANANGTPLFVEEDEHRLGPDSLIAAVQTLL